MNEKIVCDMYQQIPLIPHKNKQLLVKDHNNRFSIFSHIISYTGDRLRCHQTIALSSKQTKMKKIRSGVSADTYRTCRCRGSMTLEMVVILPFFVTFLVFFYLYFACYGCRRVWRRLCCTLPAHWRSIVMMR